MVPLIAMAGAAALNVFGVRDLPPAKYDHWPTAKVVFYNLDLYDGLQDFCRQHTKITAKFFTLGCQNRIGDTCVIALPHKGQLSDEAMNHDYRHELAHCNGWKHDG